MKKISLNSIFLRFRWRILVTFLLVILESLIGISFPLLIGIAINGLLEDSFIGIFYLAAAGAAALLVGSLRRFYDTRIYAGIYSQIAPEVVAIERDKGNSVSSISARANLLIEFVEFLEQSMPEIVRAVISLVGILIIIASLNINVFLACLSLSFLIVLIYAITGKLNFNLNKNYNNELEKQVETIERGDQLEIVGYYKRLMSWNIRLSDLETINYLVIWLGVIALFLYTPITVIGSGVLSYGLVFSVLMYVFDYIDAIVAFPIFIQQVIRLKEISIRLARN